MYMLSVRLHKGIVLTRHNSLVWLYCSDSYMNILGSLLLFHCRTMRVKHNKLEPAEQQIVSKYMSRSMSLQEATRCSLFNDLTICYQLAYLSALTETISKIILLYNKINCFWMLEWLTMSLSCSPSILRNEFCRRLHLVSNSTTVSWSWGLQSKVQRRFHWIVGSSRSANTDLKWCYRADWILHPWVKYSSFATICSLHVVRCPRKQVDNCWVLLAAVWYIDFELRTVPLLCGLPTNHGPDDLLLCPHPSEIPPRCFDMSVFLVIVYGNNSLQSIYLHQQNKRYCMHVHSYVTITYEKILV